MKPNASTKLLASEVQAIRSPIPPFQSPQVSAKFGAYPPAARAALLALRQLVFRTARSIPEVGEIAESLKWGQPAYAPQPTVGSSVRMDWSDKHPDQYAMYFHCQTNLVERFRVMFPDDFKFAGNRALVFGLDESVQTDALSVCIAAALTYHLDKRRSGMARRP